MTETRFAMNCNEGCDEALSNWCGFGGPGGARDHRIRGGGVNVPGGGANPPIDGGGAASGGGGGAAAVVGRLRFFGGGGFDGVAGHKAANTGLGSNCVAVPDDPSRGRTGTVCGR
jgi:hypothetical protein